MEKKKKPVRIEIAWLLALLILPALACQDRQRHSLTPDDVVASNLSGRNFSDKSMVGFDLSNKNLRNVNFTWADLRNTDFSGSDLIGATLDHAQLFDADFTDAKLDKRWIPIIDLLTTRMGKNQDFSSYDLSKVFLLGADLSEANLQGTNLTYANLSSANLANTNLSGANLEGTNLAGANLQKAILVGANLQGTDLFGASLTGAIVEVEQLNLARLACTRMPDGTLNDEESCWRRPSGPPP